MKKARDRVLRTEWLPVSRLTIAQYYGELFPLPRDWKWLRQSIEKHGYKSEYPIVVRMMGECSDFFEIVCGVGRHTIAREQGMKRVPTIIRQFENDNQARAYAIEDNLYGPAASTRLSLAHTISLARALKDCGGVYSARYIWEFAGVSESTFWRAVSSLDSTLQEAVLNYPEMAEMGFCQQVSEIIRRDMYPSFTKLFAGKIETHTYHRERSQARIKPRQKAEGKPASDLHPISRKQDVPKHHSTKKMIEHDSLLQGETYSLSNNTFDPTTRTAKPSLGRKRIDKEREPSLFDL